jgi:hypothetical protein
LLHQKTQFVTTLMSAQFWNKYYSGGIGGDNTLTCDPSNFARNVVTPLISPKSRNFIDMGCGNGRDTTYFASLLGVDAVTALDLSDEALASFETPVRKICAGMGDEIGDTVYDNVYSRFSLHSIPLEAQERFFDWLVDHGKTVFIETRSVNDPRYGKGEAVGDDGFIDTHYRRFTRLSDLTRALVKRGFEIVLAKEDFATSHYGKDRSVVNWVIARRVGASETPTAAPV